LLSGIIPHDRQNLPRGGRPRPPGHSWPVDRPTAELGTGGASWHTDFSVARNPRPVRINEAPGRDQRDVGGPATHVHDQVTHRIGDRKSGPPLPAAAPGGLAAHASFTARRSTGVISLGTPITIADEPAACTGLPDEMVQHLRCGLEARNHAVCSRA
jgi:hypothetical protein